MLSWSTPLHDAKIIKKGFSYVKRGLKTIDALHILTFSIGENVRVVITTILI